MITYQEDPLITTWKLYCDSQAVPGACRINLMKGLIRPFHYTCHTCQTEATGHGALSARRGCIVFDRCSDNVEAWTSSRTFTHDLPTAYCQGIGDRMAIMVVLRGVGLPLRPSDLSKLSEGQNQSGWNQLHGARHACLQVGFQCLTRNTNSLPEWEDDWFMIQVVGYSPVPYWHFIVKRLPKMTHTPYPLHPLEMPTRRPVIWFGKCHVPPQAPPRVVAYTSCMYNVTYDLGLA